MWASEAGAAQIKKTWSLSAAACVLSDCYNAGERENMYYSQSSSMPKEDSQLTESFAETLIGESNEFSREQQDVALAVLTLRSGTVSERQLSSALGTWTIHGSLPLGDHLLKLGLLDELTMQRLHRQISEELENCCGPGVSGNGSASITSLVSTLDAMDPSGTVARLMGVRAAAGVGATEKTTDRQASVPFRLVRKLGQGGLGRVWLAFDENLKRHVAVKEVADTGNADAAERFRHEAEITGRLEHPGIVPIYQLGEDAESGQAFYAMRFLGKRTLHDSILEYHERRSEGCDDPMLIRQLLTDFVNICQAIGHAHSRKVIHRDLKPENVAIDNFGQVIVIDWGIAKVIDELHVIESLAPGSGLSGNDHSTIQGQVLGTPLYMAPEQAAGRIDELDERTDIYGLGAILFAILTGLSPHEHTRDASNATGNRQLLSAIASQPTPCAHELNPDVDAALAAICAKAMARRQYARYQSASELADDVQRWMAGEPVSAHREKSSQRIARWIQNHRIWSQIIAASFIVSVVALATLGIASHQRRQAEQQILFDELRGYDREIEGQLKSMAEELAKDARFMSTLPPIQGIIDARDETQGAEGEDIWRDRLETIYAGLLRANPDYLAISYVAASEHGGQDIVRVERQRGDAAYVQRVPKSRLGAFEDERLQKQTSALSPGDIQLSVRDRSHAADMMRQGVRLVASTPVYDDTTGDLFGVVVVETDFLHRIVQFLERVEQRTASIYITDFEGDIWVSDDPETGVNVPTRDANVDAMIPDIAEFFANSDRHRRLDRSGGWIAGRVVLDPLSQQSTVGVVLQLKPITD